MCVCRTSALSLTHSGFSIIHMDEFIDLCLREPIVLEVDLPLLPKREILEQSEHLGPRVSALADEDLADAAASKREGI